MAREYLRCPCCGKLARPGAIGRAGFHVLHMRQVIRGLGRGLGFLWDTYPIPTDLLFAVKLSLERALNQVRQILDSRGEVSVRVYEDVRPRFAAKQRVFTDLPIQVTNYERHEEEETVYVKISEEVFPNGM